MLLVVTVVMKSILKPDPLLRSGSGLSLKDTKSVTFNPDKPVL